MLTHVVLMKFADPADAAKSAQLLEGLVGRVASIRDLEVRLDELRTEVSWDLLLITKHDDEAGLKAYQTDPAHLELAGWLKPRLAARAVVDYRG